MTDLYRAAFCLAWDLYEDEGLDATADTPGGDLVRARIRRRLRQAHPKASDEYIEDTVEQLASAEPLLELVLIEAPDRVEITRLGAPKEVA